MPDRQPDISRKIPYGLFCGLMYFLASGFQISTLAAEAEINPDKLLAIKELMSITGAATGSQQFSHIFSQQLLSVLRVSNPEITEQMVNIVNEEISRLLDQEFAKESLQKQIYPIYAEYFKQWRRSRTDSSWTWTFPFAAASRQDSSRAYRAKTVT